MKKLFVDTNIIIDLLAKRKDFYPPAAKLFSLADRKKVCIQISALGMANAHYIISKFEDSAKAKKVLRDLSTLTVILELNQKIIELALNDDDFKDFEDALQYFTALENDAEIIISRNAKDFVHSTIPVMSAEEFLKSLS